ncbi:MAG: hypothetical protein Kow00120_12480 [Anaerolineae bacterium]
MTMYKTFLVDKASGTFADVLTAYGLARLLSDLLYRQEGEDGDAVDVRLRDDGVCYRLTCSPALDDTSLERTPTPFLPGGARVIRTAKNAGGLPPGLDDAGYLVDYESERDRRNDFFAALSNMTAEDRREALRNPDVHHHWDIFRAVNPAALSGYNTLLLNWWAVQEALADVLRLILALYAAAPNDLEAAQAAWKKLSKAQGWDGVKEAATALQLFNPDQGKGQNRAKANSLSMGNVKGFWIPELLKVIGFYEAAQTRTLRGVKDRKTFVLAPIEIDLSEHRPVMEAFQNLNRAAETAARADILAALYYTQAMLKHVQERGDRGLAALIYARQQPKRVVAGFHVAFYKDLGNAVATMNLSFINLPGWVIVTNAQDVADYLAVLEEHVAVVRGLDESHSDAFALLQDYRDFLSGDDLAAFFRFTDGYAAYIIGQRERNRPVRQLTTDNLRRLIVGTDRKLAPILDNEGFQNIAYAIRQSTVTAQYRKKQGDRRYDVRYGLGQELARKANYPDEFIAELSDFLHKYNAENAQVMETRPGPYRRSIKTGDIDEIVRLIDEYGAKTICNLLVAYGYARIDRGDDEPASLPDDITLSADTTDEIESQEEEA